MSLFYRSIAKLAHNNIIVHSQPEAHTPPFIARVRIQLTSLASETGKQLKYYYACDEERCTERKDVPHAGQFYHSSGH